MALKIGSCNITFMYDLHPAILALTLPITKWIESSVNLGRQGLGFEPGTPGYGISTTLRMPKDKLRNNPKEMVGRAKREIKLTPLKALVREVPCVKKCVFTITDHKVNVWHYMFRSGFIRLNGYTRACRSLKKLNVLIVKNSKHSLKKNHTRTSRRRIATAGVTPPVQ